MRLLSLSALLVTVPLLGACTTTARPSVADRLACTAINNVLKGHSFTPPEWTAAFMGSSVPLSRPTTPTSLEKLVSCKRAVTKAVSLRNLARLAGKWAWVRPKQLADRSSPRSAAVDSRSGIASRVIIGVGGRSAPEALDAPASWNRSAIKSTPNRRLESKPEQCLDEAMRMRVDGEPTPGRCSEAMAGVYIAEIYCH